MTTRTIRPKVQNGPVVRRSARPVEKKSAPRKNGANVTRRMVSARGAGSRQKRSSTGGSRVYWLLVVAAAVLTSGFIFTLQSKISIHKLGQMESKLKDELDEIANRQRYEILEQQRAINPQQSDSAARQAGLIQPRLSGPRIATAQQMPVAKLKKVNRQKTTRPVISQAVRRNTRR
ncbi:MAG: hypothetical protein IPM55_10870 [Acidobacteria bacterium]|nr:hypothetical protein [Acidobacteriota bacterium]